MTTTNLLALIRGDDETLRVVVTQPNSTTPQDITGYASLRFTAKRRITDPDSDALILLSTDIGGGIEVTDETVGAVAITIDHSLTEALTTDLRLVWDLQLVDAAGRIQTIKRGDMTITRDVTRTHP